MVKIHMFPTILLAVVFLITQVMPVQSEDIELINKCTYSANRRILECTELENVSTAIALFISPGTQMLFLRNTKKLIFPINHHAHLNYLNLVGYQILNSKYFLISSGAFLGLSNVQYLEIHGNDWNAIEDNTFVGLRSLTVLSLSDNKIKKLHTYSFNHLNKLINLDLSQNAIETIPSYVFEGLSKLETLYINNNLVKHIEENAFHSLANLNILFLTNNSLEVIHSSKFNALSNLSHLNFNFNKVDSIRGQLKLPKLKFLQLAHNKLDELEDDVLEKCNTLMSIDLSNNNLKHITEVPFLKLPILKHLNLFNNFIDISSFNTLKENVLIIHNYKYL